MNQSEMAERSAAWSQEASVMLEDQTDEGPRIGRDVGPPDSLESLKVMLRELIEECAGIPRHLVEDHSTIDDTLAMDSMSLITLQVAVEERLGILCDLEEIVAQRRFDAIAETIHGWLLASVSGDTRLANASTSAGS